MENKTFRFIINISILLLILAILCLLALKFLPKTCGYTYYAVTGRLMYNPSSGKCRGYCDQSAPYDPPTVYSNFITEEERNYIIATATPDFSDSKIVSGSDENIRKSKTAWLPKTDPTIGRIINRVCNLTGIPFDHAEKMQVVKYDLNGYYNEHHDSACDDRPECIEFEENGGQRKITMVLYLTDGYEGGATKFPNLKKEYKLPKCSGLLFYPLEKYGNQCHPLALHAGMPVLSGEKYIANVWLRERAYNV